MTGEELQKMPKTSALMTKEEFAAWILSRKDAGATIEIETAELIGWWAPENKRVAVQSRIDEHNRKEEEFYENRRAAGRQIDIDTCEGYWEWADDTDPYGIALVPYEQISKNSYVRNKGSDDWVHVSDLPKEKRQALDERAERERSARRRILDGLFDALRQGGGLAAAVSAITAAEKIHGKQIVEDALQAYSYPCGAIGGLMIERGYLTMEHVAELLRGDPKGPPDIFGP